MTWKPGQDASSSISINFRVPHFSKKTHIIYGTRPTDENIEGIKNIKKAITKEFRGLTDNYISYIELDNLLPNTIYYFRLADDQGHFTKEMKFKTLTRDNSDLSFVFGGDMGSSDKTIKMMAQAASYSPDFAVVGGDIAYGNGQYSNWEKWQKWLKGWQENMVSQNGYMIPVVAVVGNHETNKWPGPSVFRAPFFHYVFDYDGQTYSHMKMGKSLNLILLDTGHLNLYSGKQLKWLEKKLIELEQEKLKIAVYHIPLYPSHRSFKLRQAKLGRQKWEPLFNKYGVKFGIENHDHTFKRSKKIWNGKLAKNEYEWTMYLGDGAWGKGGRAVGPRWYLEKYSSDAHFWLAKVSSNQIRFQAINDKNEYLDDFTEAF